MKEIMTRAWEIAREAVEKFGGKVKEYIAQALRMAWAETRKAELKEWFERKLARELNLGTVYSLDIFCKIKETEKAAYCILYTGCNVTGNATRKCVWIPKACISNYASLKEINNYEKATYAFSCKYI